MKLQLILAFIASFLTVVVVTPYVIKLAFKFGVTDQPNNRKVHDKAMPYLGGLAIFLGVASGYFTSGIFSEEITGITVSGILILILGLLDDKYDISPLLKLIGQIIAALIVVKTGLTIEILNIPFVGEFDLGIWAYPITVFWIVAITNAINLIDGLDGLAAGISSIVISTIAIMAAINGNFMILTISVIVLGSTFGFLFFNFHPAKIFMGDAGALFLGYCIAILSLLGLYKSVTLFSFIVPIIIIGVPVFDTTFAIIRRIANKKPISSPDKGHLHHRLLMLGLSHKQTVLVMYGLSIVFSITAVIFTSSTLWGSVFILCGMLISLELIAELIGLVHVKYRPVLTLYKKLVVTSETSKKGFRDM